MAKEDRAKFKSKRARRTNLTAPRPRFYLGMTVPSYFSARPSTDIVLAARQHLTKEWWERRISSYEVYVSELVLQEARRGDREAAEKRSSIISEFLVLRVTQAAIDLAGVYLRKLPLPVSAGADALHLALAAVNGMDYLLTWNCRHIARGSIIRALPAVNARAGYGTPTICTPEELLYEDSADVE